MYEQYNKSFKLENERRKIESILSDCDYNDIDNKYLKYEEPEWTDDKLVIEANRFGIPSELQVNKSNLKYVLRVVEQIKKISSIIKPVYIDYDYETE